MRSNAGGYNTPGGKKPPTSYRGPMGPNQFKYRPKYGVIVICRDEAHQKQMHETLKAEGHKTRVVTV